MDTLLTMLRAAAEPTRLRLLALAASSPADAGHVFARYAVDPTQPFSAAFVADVAGRRWPRWSEMESAAQRKTLLGTK